MKFECLMCDGHTFSIDGPSFVNDSTPVVTLSCPLCTAYHAIEHRPGGDLKPQWLRHDAARTMVAFAQRLYDETHDALKPGPDYLGRLWPEVGCILAHGA